jgi:(RS)-norcoclaurine 6-O-methyltransferase/3'-hydroxy-N-methyl-(S)-coclaurine 4'-O-methyltransferase
MKLVLYDWSDQLCEVIFNKCRKVLKEGDKLFFAGQIVDSSADDYFYALTLDHVMLIDIGGKERTVEEFKKLFHLAGFEVVDIRRALFMVVIETKAI